MGRGGQDGVGVGERDDDSAATLKEMWKSVSVDAESSERSLAVRVAYLVLTCSGSVGIYFGYNIIGATAPYLQAPPYNLDAQSIGGLAAAYSVPNMIMPLFGGAISDRLGVRVASMTYSLVVALGAFCFWLSLYEPDWSPELRVKLMMVSMAIFGLGGESLSVAQKAMLASWFRDSKDWPQLAFATGLTLTFGYVGVIINRWTVPFIAETSVPDAFLLNFVVCTGSWLAMVAASWLHRRDEASTEHEKLGSGLGEQLAPLDLSPRATHLPPPVLPGGSCNPCTGALREFCVGLRNLPRPFFLLSLMLGLSSPLFGSFETFGPAVFVDSWGYEVEAADEISSVAQLSGLVLMPLIGMLYDAKGRRLAGGGIGCAIFALSWLALTLGADLGMGSSTPIVSTVGIAAGASLFFGGLWPCVPLLVEEEHVGTAFGFMTAFQNCCLSFVLIGAGSLRDVTGGFSAMGIGLACLGGTSALLGFAVSSSWTKKDVAAAAAAQQAATARSPTASGGAFHSPASDSENPLYPQPAR
jgi:MFS family permease